MRYLNQCIVALVLLILLSAVLHPAAALKVSGVKWTEEISPGEAAPHQIVVEPSPGEGEMDVAVEVMGFSNGPDLSYTAEDTSPHSASPYLSVEPSSLHLRPGERATVQVTCAPPASASGGLYALISFRPLPSAEGSMAFVTAVRVPVMLTVAGSACTETAHIDSLDLLNDGGCTVVSGVSHTGNHHFYGLSNTVEIHDANGSVIWTGGTDPSHHALIPGSSVLLQVPVDVSLPPGTYTLCSCIYDGEGRLLDERSERISLERETAPVLSEVSVDLDPASPAVITSPDGRITLHIPAGAVSTPATLSLGPCQEVPPASEGVAPAATAFLIGGIPGRLNLPMTIEVVPSTDDLVSAGGDADRLCLAWWDSVEGRWTPVQTVFDPASVSLSALSDRPGTWSVVVVAGGEDIPVLPIFGLVLVGGIGVALLRRRWG
ncbi:hypothetical protein [Methanofollis fontis]|uniref:Uncharacterized protein n=1 Tax=Methanofollis fontis TaxID=2052832 RepID=A0A483CL59_9EURY|nr:hypothetical protein [Methanofollis fontis]TAJ43678.1 hypothetical protein CUJ86_10070 [Methanofollis fontis]